MKTNDALEALYYITAYSCILNINGLTEFNVDSSTGYTFLDDGLLIRADYKYMERNNNTEFDKETIVSTILRNGKKIVSITFTRLPRYSYPGLLSFLLPDSAKKDFIESEKPTKEEESKFLPKLEEILTDEEALNLLWTAEDILSNSTNLNKTL